MRRRHLIPIILLFESAGLIFGMQSQKPAEETSEFRWLDSSGGTEGIKYMTHQLQPLSLQAHSGPPVEIEREETKVDARTTRITSRTYNTSVNGERRLIESSVEEIKKSAGGGVSAVRTVSRAEVNGRMVVASRETQEMVSTGADTYRIVKSVYLPGINDSLVEKERVQQIEKRKSENQVEIDRIRYLPEGDGKWAVQDRRVSQNRLSKGGVETDEQVYKYDINRQLSLAQQVNVKESKDPSGQRRLRSETYEIGLDGRPILDNRTTIVLTNLGNGGQEITETTESRDAVVPSEGLKLVSKIVEQSRAAGPNQNETTLEVLRPDLNGGMEVVHSQTTIENH